MRSNFRNLEAIYYKYKKAHEIEYRIWGTYLSVFYLLCFK